MATLKGAKPKAKAASKKASAPVETKAPIDVVAEPVAEPVAADKQITSLTLTDAGAEFAPGISLMPSLRIANSLAPYKKQVDDMLAAAGRAVINSPESYEKGLKFLQISRNNFDQLETYRKSVKGPVDDYAKFIQAMFMPLLNGLRNDATRSGAYNTMSTKMLIYRQAEEKKAEEARQAERKRQQEAAQKLADEEEAKGNAEGAAAIVEAAAAAPLPPVQTPVSNMSVGGFSAGSRKTWKGTVETPMDVLRGIIDGKVPISVLEWSATGLNNFAKGLKVAGVSCGIKCEEVESLVGRG